MSGCKNCVPQRGERGLRGKDGLQGEPGPAGPAGGGIISKINFYESVVQDVNVSENLPNPNVYDFPVGYTGLTWENTTDASKIMMVQGTWEQLLNVNNIDEMSNWVDGALILTSVGGSDSVLWESLGNLDIRGSLFDGPTINDTIKIGSIPDTVQSTPNNNQVEFRFGSCNIPQNKSIIAKITVQAGEKLSLKFKTKSIASPSLLNKAQIFGQELDM